MRTRNADHTRPPNLYKRSSRSNTELSQTLFRDYKFRSSSDLIVHLGIGVVTEVAHLWKCELRYPISR